MKGLSFSTPLVPKVLDGSKTVTRRLIKELYDCFDWCLNDVVDGVFQFIGTMDGTETYKEVKPRYQPGEIVYMKEPHYRAYKGTKNDQIYFPSAGLVVWQDGRKFEGSFECAIDVDSYIEQAHPRPPWRKMGARYLPEWASRQKLLIVSVRAERLQDITEAEAKAEGAVRAYPDIDNGGFIENISGTFRYGFQALWDSIYAKTYPWESNPWVWVISFRRADS